MILTLRDQVSLADLAVQSRPGQAASSEALIRALKAKAETAQPALLKRLRQLEAAGEITAIEPLWMINAVAVTGSTAAIEEVSQRSEVRKASEDYLIRLTDRVSPLPMAVGPANPVVNLSQVQAPLVWMAGVTGKGIIVANLDTGVSLQNRDLAARWRGGSNSWFDVNGEHLLPTDSDGHGTETMSIMVGTNSGVAPGARWIAVKLFNDAGEGTLSGAIQGYQWILDPDGNPATPDGAQVVNNSWGFDVPGCFDDAPLHQALQTLLAANVLPVFAAGNLGYDGLPPSDTSPANFAEAFAVGSIDYDNSLSYFSSQGPTACRAKTIFPDLVAPGNMVPVQGIFGDWGYNSGTSFSAPHVAGSLALLLEAFPHLTAEEQRQALIRGAVDLGQPGPDNSFGAGRLDALFSFHLVGGQGPYQVRFTIRHNTPVWP
jgi:subtilisin family serine protease